MQCRGYGTKFSVSDKDLLLLIKIWYAVYLLQIPKDEYSFCRISEFYCNSDMLFWLFSKVLYFLKLSCVCIEGFSMTCPLFKCQLCVCHQSNCFVRCINVGNILSTEGKFLSFHQASSSFWQYPYAVLWTLA